MSTVVATATVPTTELATETETKTVVTTKDKPVPTTVKQTVVKTVPIPKTKVETKTVEVVPGRTGDHSYEDGNYLVGSHLAAGNYQCQGGSSGGTLYWETDDSTGEIIANGLTAIAFIGSNAHSVVLNRYAGEWVSWRSRTRTSTRVTKALLVGASICDI